MIYSTEVQHMCPVAKGAYHGPAPIPEEGKWVQSKEIKDISGLTHGIGWCAPQQGTCKLTLNVKDGIIQEALVETIGCSGMTHSAAMAAEILPGKTVLEALNTDLVCDAINVAMRELFLQIADGRTQTAFSEGGLPIGAGMEDLGKGLRSQVGTMYSTAAKGVRYLEMAEGYVLEEGLDDLDDPFLKEGLRLMVDGNDGSAIRSILENEMAQAESRHMSWINVVIQWAGFAPGYGMMGTVIGLIGMLRNLEDKSALGPNMAVALITTLYGSMLANWLFGPLAQKLIMQNGNEMNVKEMVLEGILSIQAGDNPRILGQKLLTYLDPKSRKAIESDILKD